jgi:probable F420-dependent oxidoreductase
VPDFLWQLPDPLLARARAGATANRIKLGTGVCLIPERNPILTAKQVATLDDSSGGRFLLGIGAGWNPEESTILGGDFEHRWSQVKDYVAAMKVLWTEDISEYHGRYVDFPPVRCFPKPKSKPHPPILLGSINNPRALRRVAEWGDGWLPVVRSVDEFADGVQRIKAIAADIGRDRIPSTSPCSGRNNGGRHKRSGHSSAWARIGSCSGSSVRTWTVSCPKWRN